MSFFSLCIPDSFEPSKPVLDSSPPDTEFLDLSDETMKTIKSFGGVVVNSFCELESDYVGQYQKAIGERVWTVGPAALCNKDEEDMMRRGGNSVDCEACLQWLDRQASDSVVYVCFGSLSDFTTAQLHQIAIGLDLSQSPFIWVVRDKYADRLPLEYDEGIEGRGIIIRGWAPQMLILNHRAIGGFVTHCGWNSCLEAVNAGLPLVTWPLFADQFQNERLMVEVLGIGVSLGAKKIVDLNDDDDETAVVTGIQIARAVDEVMSSGEEAENRRRKARVLKMKASGAVREGGSSYTEIENLITDLKGWWGFPREAPQQSRKCIWLSSFWISGLVCIIMLELFILIFSLLNVRV